VAVGSGLTRVSTSVVSVIGRSGHGMAETCVS
jgi:hypothetical protein